MSFAPVIDHLRPAIFQLCLHATELSEALRAKVGSPFINRVLGTGFLISRDGHAITALHVITQGEKHVATMDAARKGIVAGLPQPNTENMRGNFSQVAVTVIARDERHDLALLKLDPNPFAGVRSGISIGGAEIQMVFGTARLNTQRPLDGEFVLASGYPLNATVLISNSGIIASSWSFDIKEMPLPDGPPDWLMPNLGDIYLADIEVNPGNSGGPVYLSSDASTIGVCVATQLAPVVQQGESSTANGTTLFYSSGLTVVIPARYVVDLAKAHDVAYIPSDRVSSARN